MKHSAAKSLGVAALGAAFAAAGVGSAAAMAPSFHDDAATVGNVTSPVPVDDVAQAPPADSAQALNSGEKTVGGGLHSAKNHSEQVATSGEPVEGLLGGVPVKGGTPVQGLPQSG